MKTTKHIKKTVLKASRMAFVAIVVIGLYSCKEKEGTKNNHIMETHKSEHVILINPFEVPKSKLEESIKYWETGRNFLKTQPGYISTKLHQSIIDNARFQLINIAIWENPEAFNDATTKMHKKFGAPPVEGHIANPSLYTVIRE